MGSSWKIGRFLDIDVFIHWSFPLIILYFLYISGAGSAATVALSVAFILLLFVCVTLHEYGHALAARGYGINTRSITLSPIGGVAQLESIPEKPRQELWVAIAGPLVNVAIAAVLIPFAFFAFPLSGFGEEIIGEALVPDIATLVWALGAVNISLVLFNLIPAFPMDGGRVLRALLAMKLGRLKATTWAVRIGQFFALLFAIYAIVSGGSPFLFIIAIFIYFAARSEERYVKIDHALSNRQIHEVTQEHFYSADQNATLQETLSNSVNQGEDDLLVTDEGRYIGVLRKRDLMQKVLREQTGSASVLSATLLQVPSLQLTDSAKVALKTMQKHRINVLPVMNSGEMVGVVYWRVLQQLLQYNNFQKSSTAAN